MMSVPATAGWNRKTSHDYIGPILANDPHDIAQDLLAIPKTQRFLWCFREAEIYGASEKLPAAIEPACCEQFLRARDAELFVKLRANFVLPAVAARQRKIGGAIAATAREISEQSG